MKRASTRNVVLSKAMKYVDEETRKEFRDKRLLALEADNYVENETKLNADDDVYAESDVSQSFSQICLQFTISLCPFQDDGLPKKKKAKVAKVKDIRSKWYVLSLRTDTELWP